MHFVSHISPNPPLASPSSLSLFHTLSFFPQRMIGGCVSSCLGGIAASCACSGAKAFLCAKSGTMMYMAIFFIMSLLTLVARYWSGLTVNIYVYKFDVCDTSRCVGSAAVFRLTFGTALFFLLLGLAAMVVKNPTRFDKQYWPIKAVFFIGMLVAAWFLPHTFYNSGFYTTLLYICGAAFILFQVAALIHSVHNVHETWLERGWLKGILAVSTLFIAASITLCVLAFKWFTSRAVSCSLHTGLLTVTIIAVVAFTALSLSPLSRNGLLPAAVLGTYCFYIVFSAMMGDFDLTTIMTTGSDPCNAFGYKQNAFSPFQVVLGMLLSIFTVTYAAYSTSSEVKRSHAALSSSRRSSLGQRSGDIEANIPSSSRRNDAGSLNEAILNPSSAGVSDSAAYASKDSADASSSSSSSSKGAAATYTAPKPAAVSDGGAANEDGEYGATTSHGASNGSGTGRQRVPRASASSDSAHDDADDSDNEDDDLDGASASGKARSMALAHLVLALGCFSIATTLTSWGFDSIDSVTDLEDAGRATLWAKIASQWAVVLVYIWTFVAPVMLKDREFD